MANRVSGGSATLCRHCHIRPIARSRGLCNHCYWQTDIRKMYPPGSPRDIGRSAAARVQIGTKPLTDDQLSDELASIELLKKEHEKIKENGTYTNHLKDPDRLDRIVEMRRKVLSMQPLK